MCLPLSRVDKHRVGLSLGHGGTDSHGHTSPITQPLPRLTPGSDNSSSTNLCNKSANVSGDDGSPGHWAPAGSWCVLQRSARASFSASGRGTGSRPRRAAPAAPWGRPVSSQRRSPWRRPQLTSFVGVGSGGGSSLERELCHTLMVGEKKRKEKMSDLLFSQY